MTKCDLCMTEIRSSEAVPLQKYWQVEGVKEVCKECADEITDVYIALTDKVAHLKEGIRKHLIPQLYAKLRRRREEPT
jgi:hypothetical protein